MQRYFHFRRNMYNTQYSLYNYIYIYPYVLNTIIIFYIENISQQYKVIVVEYNRL